MTETPENTEKDGNSWAKNIILVMAAVIAAVFALKFTVWALKTALFVGAVGLVGYVGYSALKKRVLGSDEKPAPTSKQLADQSLLESDEDDPLKEINSVLKELEELKKTRRE